MKNHSSAAVMLLLLHAVLILAMLALTFAGAKCYTNMLNDRNKHTRQRSALSFIQTQAVSCGGRGNVILRDGPEGTAVCFREPDTAYETRIYLYNGSLCTEYSRADHPINALYADAVCFADDFSAAWESAELLSVTADGVRADVWCPGGGGK